MSNFGCALCLRPADWDTRVALPAGWEGEIKTIGGMTCADCDPQNLFRSGWHDPRCAECRTDLVVGRDVSHTHHGNR